jgi:hypothetical protein
MRALAILLVSTLTLTLCACYNLKPEDAHRAECNQLKSNIIFGGSTSITRQANIQSAEKPMQQRLYEKNNC